MTVTQNPLPGMAQLGIKPKVRKYFKYSKKEEPRCTCRCDVCNRGVHCSIGFDGAVCKYPIKKSN